MAQSTYAKRLARQIEDEYKAGSYKLGWRFLYSPARVLDGAPVAFIGLNPGGNSRPANHAEFALGRGSAYELERWKGHQPGESQLQLQVRALFRKIRVRPADVLAGNLVPFRSTKWEALPDRKRALAFGEAVWRDVLTRAKPKLVIAMGGLARGAVKDILGLETANPIPVNWGQVKAERGRFSGGVFVGIPHLSRFAIMDRAESAEPLRKLLAW